MIRFTIGLLGLIVISGAHDSVSLLTIALAAIPCLGLMIWSIPDIAE